MALELVVVDAFTDQPFSGNPAAVAIVDAFPDEARMQLIASEMALSETAFCVPHGNGAYDLRWFTPTVEVALCGHATLAAAHVLGGSGAFSTRSGVLRCRALDDGRIAMDFPAGTVVPAEAPLGFSLPGQRVFARGAEEALVELSDAAAVRSLVPDLAALAALGTCTVIVTAPGDRAGVDCVSRVFGPNVGIAEDPVTGSAHCTLAVWWGDKLGRDELCAEQASRRGGTLWTTRRGDRVELAGNAVTVAEVRLLV
ncbi:MAG: PhzF family phenazine biosynthesis protein [Acidimicrobiales bacterium]